MRLPLPPARFPRPRSRPCSRARPRSRRDAAMGRVRRRLTGAALAVLSGVALIVVGPASAGRAATTCSDVDVIVARGTGEPGTLGMFVGDPVYRALQAKITTKKLSAYPVNYPASLVQPASVQAGNTDAVNHLVAQAAACPGQRFILVGYSQGANVMDNSIGISSAGAVVGGPIVATIPAALAPRVAAILLFGNPIRALGKSVTGPYAARTIDFCANGDPVCQAGGIDFLAHLGYGNTNADAAAAFAAARV